MVRVLLNGVASYFLGISTSMFPIVWLMLSSLYFVLGIDWD